VLKLFDEKVFLVLFVVECFGVVVFGLVIYSAAFVVGAIFQVYLNLSMFLFASFNR
jgi:hypothetical protein